MAELNINIQPGGLNRQSANTDEWGGLFVEVDSLPGSWTANEVRTVFRVEDLETFGITADATNFNYQLVYWHVSEVFRLAPNARLYVQLGVPASNGITPATVMGAFQQAENRLRLFGYVSSTTTIADAAVEAMETAMGNLFTNNVQPARCIVTYKKDVGDVIPDFSADDNYRVMVDIANDRTAGGLAVGIFGSSLGMCGAAGTHLGQLLRLRVHQKPSWRSFPVDGGGRWQLLGDINGGSVENATQTEIAGYATNGLNLVTRTLRLTDAFISNSRMAGDTSDDFAVINNGRVIDKAAVLLYDAYVRALDGPVYVDPANGRIAPETVARLEQAGYNAVNNNMVQGLSGNDVELSVDVNTGQLPVDAIFIDPTQNVLSTEQIIVQARLTPVGAASTITINLGLQVPQT